jgi:hypothetical protein
MGQLKINFAPAFEKSRLKVSYSHIVFLCSAKCYSCSCKQIPESPTGLGKIQLYFLFFMGSIHDINFLLFRFRPSSLGAMAHLSMQAYRSLMVDLAKSISLEHRRLSVREILHLGQTLQPSEIGLTHRVLFGRALFCSHTTDPHPSHAVMQTLVSTLC